MDGLAFNPLVLAGAAGLLLLIVILLVVRLMRGRGDSDIPDYLKRVRQLVAQGKLTEAAHVQLQEGNLQEAYNLFARADEHAEAARLAEKLKLLEKAAFHAEKAGDFKKAAQLQASMGEWADAGRLYKRTGDFRKAAEALEKSGNADIRDLGPLWEKACMELLPDNAAPTDLDPDILVEIKLCAERAAEAFKQAGENEKAALFYNILQRDDEANSLRGRSTTSLLTKMTQLPGLNAPGDATDLIRRAGALQADSPELAQFASIVGDAIKHAMTAPQPVILSQEDFQRSVGRASESGSAINSPLGHLASTIAREVIYIRDATTNEETPVTRDSERYSISDKLGEGGMAVVFKAHDNVLERDIALKFLPEGLATHPMALKFFEREAKAAAGLSHPNIVIVHDYGILDKRPFICMELVDGDSMDKRLNEPEQHRGLDAEELLTIAEGLFSALHAAHQRGVVHRDVKPSNIMVTSHGHVKLMDFGIARGIDPDQATMIVGTPYYMAPEQFIGVGIDHRTDLFASGVTLYELATHTLPYEGQNRLKLPERAIKRRPDLDPEIDALIWHCLQPDPDDRPASAEELLKTIRHIKRHTDPRPSFGTPGPAQPSHTEEDPLDLDAFFDEAQTVDPRRADAPQRPEGNLALANTLAFDTDGEPDPWAIAFDPTSSPSGIRKAHTHPSAQAPIPLPDDLAESLLSYLQDESATAAPVVNPGQLNHLLRSGTQLSPHLRQRLTQEVELSKSDDPMREEIRQMLLDYLND